MSISLARLLTHLYCTCMLLLHVTNISAFTLDKLPPTTAATNDFENSDSSLNLSPNKDKCQYNLTESSQSSLEAKSSIYQLLGFSKCEYIIQAPSSHFLLLSFTEIHSHSDMPVETSVLQQHFQQKATEATTSQVELFVTKTPLSKSSNHQTVNSSTPYSDRELVPTTLENTHLTQFFDPKNLHDNSKHSTVLPHNGSSLKRKHVKSKTILDDHSEEHTISKESIEKSNKDPEVIFSAVKDKDYKHSTASGYSSVDIHADQRIPNCSLKLIIEEVSSSAGSIPQVICWEESWQQRIPLVFQYSVPVRITYVWDRLMQSGFSLDVKFVTGEEDCHFPCNSHLCLPKRQLCDGYFDCPDHSDEHNSTCSQASQHGDSGEPQMINVIIIISVIFGIILVLALIFMISHIRSHDGACRRGDSLLQPPHSQSSEVCRSPTSSVQESGHYETLLHQHSQRPNMVPNLMAASSWCMERQQLLQQQHHEPEVEQHQRLHPLMSRKYHGSQIHQLCPLRSEVENCEVRNSTMISSTKQQQIQHTQQQRKHKHACKHISPDELYPPNIPLSADGEEGYAMSQKALYSKQQLERNWQAENEVFRPPPNKTVFDRDSPPPPYSPIPPETHILDSPVGVVCVLRQARSCPTPPRFPMDVSESPSLSCHY